MCIQIGLVFLKNIFFVVVVYLLICVSFCDNSSTRVTFIDILPPKVPVIAVRVEVAAESLPKMLISQ